jgi:hypothetical protein
MYKMWQGINDLICFCDQFTNYIVHVQYIDQAFNHVKTA